VSFAYALRVRGAEILYSNLPYDGYEGGQWMDRTNATWNTWNEVGRYTYWREDVQHLADNYLRDAFGISKGEDVPDYISVHIRRTGKSTAYFTRTQITIELD
jgi:hypothetical protein